MRLTLIILSGKLGLDKVQGYKSEVEIKHVVQTSQLIAISK